MAATVATHNLAIGVVLGVLTATVLFARRVSHLVTVDRQVAPLDGVEAVTYRVEGALFFAPSNDLYNQFQYGEDPQTVVIDLSDSHIWDASTVSALDSITAKYERLGKTVRIQGLNPTSRDFQDRLSGQLGAGH